MGKYLVLIAFAGALRGCYVKNFAADSVVEIDDPDLEAVALKEGWIEPHVEPEEVDPEQFPEDYALYIILQEIQLPGPDGNPAGDILAVGEEFGMSAADAQEWIDAGLIKPKPEPEAEPAKAAPKAPKNKAVKAAPKSKEDATE